MPRSATLMKIRHAQIARRFDSSVGPDLRSVGGMPDSGGRMNRRRSLGEGGGGRIQQGEWARGGRSEKATACGAAASYSEDERVDLVNRSTEEARVPGAVTRSWLAESAQDLTEHQRPRCKIDLSR